MERGTAGALGLGGTFLVLEVRPISVELPRVVIWNRGGLYVC